MKTRTKLTVAGSTSALLLIGGLGAATDGFSAWTSLLQQALPLNSAVVQLQVGSSDSLTTAISNFVPGDSSESLVDLSNTGTVPFSAVTLSTTDCAVALSGGTCSSAPNALVTSTSGLQIQMAACSVPWTAATTNGVTTYSCSGTQSAVLSQSAAASIPTPTSSNPLVLSLPTGTIAPGTQAYVMVTTSLPATAPQSLAGLSDYVQYNFTGVQPVAGSIG